MRLVVMDNTNFSGWPIGGAGTFVGNVLPYLARCFELVAMGPQFPGHQGRNDVPRIPTVVVAGPGSVRLHNLLGSLRTAVRYRKHFDVAYVHSPELVWAARLCARRVVLHLHGTDNPASHSRFVWARGRLVRFLYRYMFLDLPSRMADQLFVADILSHVDSRVRAKATTVVNPFRGDVFYPGRDTSQPTGVARLLFVGRLAEVKQIDAIIAAADLLHNSGTLTELRIIGSGELLSALRERARLASAVVSFEGALSSEGVSRWMRTSDALVLASASEGIPTVAIESLACGAPVVAPRIGGMEAVVRPRLNGELVDPPITPEKLACAIKRVLDARYTREACAKTVEEFEMTHLMPKLSQYLQAVGQSSQ